MRLRLLLIPFLIKVREDCLQRKEKELKQISTNTSDPVLEKVSKTIDRSAFTTKRGFKLKLTSHSGTVG